MKARHDDSDSSNRTQDRDRYNLAAIKEIAALNEYIATKEGGECP